MKIYTKKGDGGRSRQMDGHFISKTDPQILAVGALDETQSWLGLVIADLSEQTVGMRDDLQHIQRLLYRFQADVSIDGSANIHDDDVIQLETSIDRIMAQVDRIRAFILPGGGHTGAQLQVARVLARRAERACVALHEARPEWVRPEGLRFINRLSDYLFAMALLANHLDGVAETPAKES
ncbi:cob(I)yrinic acid a,c-diamide adenosyltransferase [Bifidobacterium mongoliense]|uniref:Corrinoid adenosyltransferase n=1 Tax=Bifidobacterium mongoliense TaxID=518643 RepID=A0A423UCQ6_9BIFI|nr:cob(I)yrinic acid a,c-diamide adenosyltransferase [Bifidobacterium mongoliense]ROT86487.1 ATP--cob(I)alamin adenosyltransferase [Bifidobacterium mongoliense]